MSHKEASARYYARNKAKCNAATIQCEKRRLAKNPFANAYSGILQSAKNRQLSVCISRESLAEWLVAQKKECVYCSVTQDELVAMKKRHRLTIDRKNNEVGYVRENLALACWSCNVCKSDVFTHEEFLEIGRQYLRPKVEKMRAAQLPYEGVLP